MEIQDIIKSDKDRIFIVDHECFLIYTGESVEDSNPFIRIGNWLDIPVELIPLTENIIITDEITGNPSLEQFNINLDLLESNRYIGSGNPVKRFLDFQKIFNLDLTNASIVEIEKDIPELSTEKNISEKNQFIGVFYSNGNFKIVYGGRSIFDLFELKNKAFSTNDINNKLMLNAENRKPEKGQGFYVSGSNPIFFSDSRLASYLFPLNYYSFFSQYGINPESITEIIYPSLNMINLTKIIKWKNYKRTPLTIYSDNFELIEPIKKLYNHCPVYLKKFCDMKLTAGNNLLITSYPDSYNVKALYGRNSNEIKASFVKSVRGIEAVIKDNPDILLMPYSVFEDIIPLLKSGSVPFVVIDDGNKNISKLIATGQTVVGDGRYTLARAESVDDLLKLSGFSTEEIDSINNNPDSHLDGILNSWSDSREKFMRIYNSSSLLSFYLNTTIDRKDYSHYGRSLEKYRRAINISDFYRQKPDITAGLVLFDKKLYTFLSEIPSDKSEFSDIITEGSILKTSDLRVSSYYSRIISDRNRLNDLLALLRHSSPPDALQEENIRSLKATLRSRKENLIERSGDLDIQNSHDIPGFPEKKLNIHSDNSSRMKKSIPAEVTKRSMLYLILIIIILAAAAGGLYLHTRAPEKDPTDIIITEVSPELLEKRKEIKISNYDIFYYANKVAVMNGYHPIPEAKLNRKNPHWIFPGNVFRLHDGETVTVKSGDTLWNIAENKLIDITLEIKEIIEKIELTEDKVLAEELTSKARNLAVTGSQKKLISETDVYRTDTDGDR